MVIPHPHKLWCMIIVLRAQQRKIMASRSNSEIWMSAAASDIRWVKHILWWTLNLPFRRSLSCLMSFHNMHNFRILHLMFKFDLLTSHVNPQHALHCSSGSRGGVIVEGTHVYPKHLKLRYSKGRQPDWRCCYIKFSSCLTRDHTKWNHQENLIQRIFLKKKLYLYMNLVIMCWWWCRDRIITT